MQDTNTQEDSGQRKVHLTIITTSGNWEEDFLPATRVSEVISATLHHFHDSLSQSEQYELRRKGGGEPLDPSRSLADQDVLTDQAVRLVKAVPGGGK